MSINYVIATYNGYTKRSHTHPLPKDILRCHLQKINSLKHSLAQITIMKAKSDNYYKDYYNIFDVIKDFKIPINIIDCENYGYSGGQFLKAYEIYKDLFDYYLFIEDDYCPGMDNFDEIMISCYKEKFKNDIGILCSLVEGTNLYKTRNWIHDYPIHFEGCVFTKIDTINKLYNDPKWERNPRKWLDLIDDKIDDDFEWKWMRELYLGGYYQITFSHLFTLSGIKHENYVDIKHNNRYLQFGFWRDNHNDIIFYHNKPACGQNSRQHHAFTLEDINHSPCIPIQLKDIECIKFHTNLKITDS